MPASRIRNYRDSDGNAQTEEDEQGETLGILHGSLEGVLAFLQSCCQVKEAITVEIKG